MVMGTPTSWGEQMTDGILRQDVTQNKCDHRQIFISYFLNNSGQNGLRSIDAKAFPINTPRKFLTVGLP
jgi:hypothetical protein